MYASDGRIMGVPALQEPIYRLVGWEPEVTMYARDSYGTFTRTIVVSPYEVEAYKQVGWYIEEDVNN